MGKRRVNSHHDRARLREVVDAVSEELASGRSEDAVARDLLTLGFDAVTARRLVARVAVPPPRRKRLGEGKRRLLVDLLLLAGGVGVGFACLNSGERGGPIVIAALAVLVGAADAISALVPRRRAA